MFTYKFLGLDVSDAPTPYYYGSLPAKPELGHILVYNETGNRYVVIHIDGKGLVDDGKGFANQQELAWADIGRGETVPTLRLQKIDAKETKIAAKEIEVTSGRSFAYEEVKRYSQMNRATRLSKSA
jgi:hypothetical protein